MKRMYLLLFIVSIFLHSCDPDDHLPALPESKDLREDGNFTSVKDQGSLGSCWAFACNGLTEYFIKMDYGIEVDLSEQHLVNCAGFGPLDGMNYLKDKGVVIEQELPYQAEILDCDLSLEAEYKIESFEVIYVKEMSFEKRINALQVLLYDNGPFLTHMDLYDDFGYYNSGIYEYDGVSGSAGGHIIVVVGYQDDKSVKNGGYWICRNSWGDEWGEDGYFKIPYDECNIAIYYAYTISQAYKIGSLKKLPVDGYHCRWSKDGKKLAYTKRDDTSVGIWVYDFETEEETIAVNGMDGDMHLSWLDDGKNIIFDAYNSSKQLDLWTINIESGVRSKIIDKAFNPDAHYSDDKLICVKSGQLALFSKSGNLINNISNINGWNAAISPDSNKIALVSDESGNEDIWIIDVNGTNKKRITTFDGRDYWPRWSPDGKMIAFESERSGNSDVWVYNIESSKFIQITTNSADDRMGDWSPDGKSILFNSNRGGSWGVYIYRDVF